ncbi:MAG: hypothetical protein JSU87_13810 [Gemmatimonadota bacterium]|nr:MAG: hypothetical protein JSU87_13810 [Gemmatimonadota bacterium]
MKEPKTHWLARVAAFALALSVFTACGDDENDIMGSQPDPVEAAATLDGLVAQFVEGNEALESLDVLSPFITGALQGNVVALHALPSSERGGIYNWARSLQVSLTELRASSDGPDRIPVGALGKTFVYNTETSAYEIDPTRTDAPANGVWFILYAVDPIIGQPILPLREIGHIEIIDTSSFPTANIGLTAVIDDVGTLIDVDVSGTFTSQTIDLDFSGTLSDGSQSLTFDIDVTGSETAFNINFSLTFAPYTISFIFSGDASGGGSITATLSEAGGGQIRFLLTVDAAGTIGSESGIYYNSDRVAIISGNIESPVITNGAGDPLTQEELTALRELFEGLGAVFELFQGLVEFSLFLLLLAL